MYECIKEGMRQNMENINKQGLFDDNPREFNICILKNYGMPVGCAELFTKYTSDTIVKKVNKKLKNDE